MLAVRTSEVEATLAPLSYVTINMPYISIRMRVYHTYSTFAVPRNTPLVTNKILDWQSPLFISLAVSIMLRIKLTACGIADMLPVKMYNDVRSVSNKIILASSRA